VIVVIRELAEDLRPCYVHRHAGVTVVYAHPGTPRPDGVAWATEHLTVEERNYLRFAEGQPPVGQPLTDAYSDGTFPVQLAVFSLGSRGCLTPARRRPPTKPPERQP